MQLADDRAWEQERRELEDGHRGLFGWMCEQIQLGPFERPISDSIQRLPGRPASRKQHPEFAAAAILQLMRHRLVETRLRDFRGELRNIHSACVDEDTSFL